jgi:hypothetical protein
MAETGSRDRDVPAVRYTFCSKRQSEVLAMFEGGGAFICDRCVALFAEEVAKRTAPSA